MSYARSDNMSETAVVADLYNANVNEVEQDDRFYTFEINSSIGHVVLQAENETELAEWMMVFHAIHSRAGQLSNRKDSLTTNNTPPRSSISSTTYLPPVQQDIGYTVLLSGPLAVKDFKPTRRLSASQKELHNVVWRTCHFALHSDGKLVQHPASSDPHDGGRDFFEVLDLHQNVDTRHAIQYVDESLFHRRHVFVVQTRDGRVMYLAAPTATEMKRWVYAMKGVTSSWLDGFDGCMYRVYRKLELRIIEGRGVGASDPYCDVYFEVERVGRTNTRFRSNGDPFWREDFVFE